MTKAGTNHSVEQLSQLFTNHWNNGSTPIALDC